MNVYHIICFLYVTSKVSVIPGNRFDSFPEGKITSLSNSFIGTMVSHNPKYNIAMIF